MDPAAILHKYILNDYHTFEISGVPVLYNINTTAYGRYTPVLQRIVASKEKNDAGQLRQAMEEFGLRAVTEGVQWLVRKSFLVKQKPEITCTPEYKYEIRTLVLSICHDCNLGCTYCYAHEGKYLGETGLISIETARESLDYFVSHSGSQKILKLFLFGGEPLICFDLIKDIVAYARTLETRCGKLFHIGLTTNATLLTRDKIDYFDQNNITVHVSIDGPKDIHDTNRMFKNGQGSHDVICENLKHLFATRPNQVTSRATYSHGNIEIEKSAQHILDLGFRTVYIGPAHGLHQSSLRKEDIEIVKEQYNTLADHYLEKKLKGEKVPINPLDARVKMMARPVRPLRFHGCGAGRGYFVISKDGEIYPCKKVIGMEEFKLGTVKTEMNRERCNQFLNNTTTDPKKDCFTCWSKYVCGGACVLLPIDYGIMDLAKSRTIMCDIHEHITKLAMMINIKLAEALPKKRVLLKPITKPRQKDISDLNMQELSDRFAQLVQ